MAMGRVIKGVGKKDFDVIRWDFNKRSQQVAEAGRKLAPDFLPKINEMNTFHGTLPPHFIEAVMEAGETNEGAAKLIYDLANDFEKAAEVLALSPSRQAVVLAKMVAKQEKPKDAPKAAPAPIEPKIGSGRSPGGGKIDIYDAKTPVDDWMKAREAEARANRRW
jgi:hypothetical protein